MHLHTVSETRGVNANTTYDVECNRLAVPCGVVNRHHPGSNDGEAEALVEPVCFDGQQPDITALSVGLSDYYIRTSARRGAT